MARKENEMEIGGEEAGKEIGKGRKVLRIWNDKDRGSVMEVGREGGSVEGQERKS